jgi:hypothetical protein
VSLNFTTLAYNLVIHLKDEKFTTKSFDLQVDKIVVTQKDFQYNGRIPILHVDGVELKFFGSDAEIRIQPVRGFHLQEYPSLRLDESAWPVGTIPKGIFRTVPEIFGNSDIILMALSSKLNVQDNFSLVFDRHYLVDLSLTQMDINLMPELFPAIGDTFTCTTSMGTNVIRIEWAVFAPHLVVSTFSWILGIKYKSGLELQYAFTSLYNTWSVSYKDSKQYFVGDLPVSSYLLKHILENNFKYDFSHLTAKKSCEFDFARINVKYGHLEVHERWNDPVTHDTYSVGLDYRSAWGGGSLEWMNNGPEKTRNRLLLFATDFKSLFMRKIMTSCEKAHNIGFQFH